MNRRATRARYSEAATSRSTSWPSWREPASTAMATVSVYSARTLSPILSFSMATSLPAFTLKSRPSGPVSVTRRVFMSILATVTVPLMPTLTSPAGLAPRGAACAGGGDGGLDGLGAGRLEREDHALADGDLDDVTDLDLVEVLHLGTHLDGVGLLLALQRHEPVGGVDGRDRGGDLLDAAAGDHALLGGPLDGERLGRLVGGEDDGGGQRQAEGGQGEEELAVHRASRGG